MARRIEPINYQVTGAASTPKATNQNITDSGKVKKSAQKLISVDQKTNILAIGAPIYAKGQSRN